MTPFSIVCTLAAQSPGDLVRVERRGGERAAVALPGLADLAPEMI